ncbi:NADPH:quinone oxidoreductase family protein [Taklimakanibacter lacteus]|uniref:NADPH:quinone oxidoreductase family protein n=1 Tax=Taklimakanibacter lacteus TaxID=2268456 RepID=UPI000E6610CA
MRAVLCKAAGGASSLSVETIARVKPGPDEVAVAVKAVGLNFFDTLIIEGKYQVKPPMPFSPGGEIAGIVSETGAQVRHLKAGDRVMGYIGHGGAREEAVVAARQLSLIPPGLSDEIAAGLSITYGTTLHALKDRARLEPGETLAVLGASGGVGQAAVEIGKLMGAHVIACASSDDKLAFCKSFGADEVLNYRTQNLKDGLRSLRQDGVDVVYDPVGGDLTEPAVRTLGWGGRHLVVGFAQGDIPKLPLNLILLKNASLLGVFWGAHTEREPELHRANMDQLLAWAAAGQLKPHIHATYRFEEIGEALGAIARREVKGKTILVP